MSLINVKNASNMQKVVTIGVYLWKNCLETRRQDVELQEVKRAVDRGC